jgi:uncharacterized membrane protein YqiK
MPIYETSEMMDIGPQKVELDHRDVKMLSDGVDRKASIMATATVKFLMDEEGLQDAAEHLLHVNHSDVGRIAKNFIEARLRSTLRTMEIKVATSDLTKTALHVQERVSDDMLDIGVVVENLTIHKLNPRGG